MTNFNKLLSQRNASAGMKAAGLRGADSAAQLPGHQDGFWANNQARIPLSD